MNSFYLMVISPILLSALAGVLAIIFHSSKAIHSLEDTWNLLFVITIVILADSGAYFVGRFLGKHKLSPRVSPKKTVEGLLGGMTAVVIFVILCQSMVSGWYLGLPKLLLISLVSALFSVVGDLFISIIKRQNNVKDSSHILPGHGGVLDRLDGLLAAIPLFYLLQQFV